MWWLFETPLFKRYGLPIVCTIIGAGLMLYGYAEAVVFGHAKSEPHEITCARLAESGPGDNAYVAVTDFRLGEAVTRHHDDGSVIATWVTLVPAGEGEHVPRVIVTGSPKEIRSAGKRLEGIVANEIWSLSRQQKEFLKGPYPDVDLNRVWVIEADRTPTGLGSLFLILGIGLVFLLMGIYCVWSAWRHPHDRPPRPRRRAPVARARLEQPRPLRR